MLRYIGICQLRQKWTIIDERCRMKYEVENLTCMAWRSLNDVSVVCLH